MLLLVPVVLLPLNSLQHPGANEAGLLWITSRAKLYPKAGYFWFGPWRPVVVLKHPQTVKRMVQRGAPKPISGSYGLILPWLGKMLSTCT